MVSHALLACPSAIIKRDIIGARRTARGGERGGASATAEEREPRWEGKAQAVRRRRRASIAASEQRGDRIGSAGNRERAAMRRALAHSSERGRRESRKSAGDCAPQGEKARKQGGKR